ncbi:MAG: AMP-binding protein [Bacteroidota bacterium]|nr:AMP-binding protein [Bacteroidota bacterium]
MKNSSLLTLPALFAQTVSKHSTRNAMAMVGETPFTYNDLDLKIRAVMGFLEKLGLKPGDRVAILSSNMPNWAITYYAIAFSGSIVVPVLPDFNSREIETILLHADPKILFASRSLLEKIKNLPVADSMIIIRIEDFSIYHGADPGIKYSPEGRPAKEYPVKEEDLAAIIYTSGTMGKSKGVMLTHKNICFTAIKGDHIQLVTERDRFLSILPLSHTYENTLGMILPMIKGACIYYLGKAPSSSILMPVLQEVRPTVLLSVPLIIEKIYRKSIQPKFERNFFLRYLIRVPFFRKKLNLLAGKKLMKTFGGELHFFGIGGAKLNQNVEQFLIEARFPYAIGYGMTEASPLLAGYNPQHFRLQSTGPALEDTELKINNPDKISGEGEIWARGSNVMRGYYKDPELTSEIITPEGWLKTGDLGVLDEDGYLYIKGRLKNMIVLSGGENIYPEEIESVINNFQHVSDSLVIEQEGKLVALVQFNRAEIEENYSHLQNDFMNFVEMTIEQLRIELQRYVNRRVNKFSQLQLVLVQSDPFEKTATMKIKRYLYQ